MNLAVVVAVVLSAPLAGAENSPPEQVAYFEEHVRPTLVSQCYECHSGPQAKGGLRLDWRGGWQQGGESGPAVVPGRPEESLLVQAIKHDGLVMPPKKKLAGDLIARLEHWIRAGAIDPRSTAPSEKEAATVTWQAKLAERRRWWSLQPPAPHEPPPVKNANWSSHPIDRFILASLEAQNLQPAPQADPRTLVRRLSYALTGLPPTEEEVNRFVSQVSLSHHRIIPLSDDEMMGSWDDGSAYAVLTDRLLSSPRFGERWARHWMDVVRYTDTHGYEWDVPARGAWEYRDYLIRAFNGDVSFQQLLREQIAGDLLERPRVNQELGINESLIGTMFMHLGERRHGDSSEFNGIHQEMINDQVDAFSKALQATTVGCARCHDHKLDAVSQRDFYALAGTFMSSRWVCRTLDLPDRNSDVLAELRALKATLREDVASIWKADAARLPKDFKSFATKKSESKPTDELADPFYPWRTLIAAERDGKSIAEAWTSLAARYAKEAESRTAANKSRFRIVADFANGLPQGWSADGVGLAEPPVKGGDFAVALEGSELVDGLLPDGWHTHTLSPRLNGAIRSPLLSTLGGKFLTIEYLGDDYSSHRTVIENAFHTEKQVMLESPRPAWQSFATNVGEQFTAYIEFATKASNPNFPPRVHKVIKGYNDFDTAPDDLRKKLIDVLDERRSWFGLVRAVVHDEPGTPRDELTAFSSLFQQSAPENVEQAAQAYSGWVAEAVERWQKHEADNATTQLLQAFLDRGLLTNQLDGANAQAAAEIVRRYRAAEQRLQQPHTVTSFADVEPGRDYPLFAGGDYDQIRELVPRGYLEVFSKTNTTQPTFSGRRELAEQIASPNNPLTARVFVNRVWHWLFGRGLVATTDDFGHLGERPTHPELLDYLTRRFIDEGWSLKKLVRLIVTSRTWQQSGDASPRAVEIDPQNRLWHHYPLRRLEAEAVRDAMLLVSGRLDDRMFGPTVEPFRPKQDGAKYLFSGPLDGDGRRSIYVRVAIMEPPKFLAAFNQPAPKIPTGRRDVTNVPAQSLTLLNDPFTAVMAERWAERMIGDHSPDVATRLRGMFTAAYARDPTQAETQRWTGFLQELAGASERNSASLMTKRAAWRETAHAIFNSKEFIFIR